MKWSDSSRRKLLQALVSGQLACFADGKIELSPEQLESAADKPVWIHVATEGEYRGHPAGDFTLNQAVFDKFIANFRASARYKVGPDGYGTAKVVPFDYEHASEMQPYLGEIPTTGAPAPAWALDMKTEVIDGKVRLFALVKLGSRVREQIHEEEYSFTSIAFRLEGNIDPATGKDVGPKISSIAFTNRPFIDDLMPIAASARRILSESPLGYFWPAKTPEEALGQLREMLKKPLSTTVDEVFAEALGMLDAPPQGVQLDDLLQAFRSIFNLGPNRTVAEIKDELGKVRDQLIQQDSGSPMAQGEPPSTDETTQASQVGATMALSELGKKLARKFEGIRLSKTITFAEDSDVEAAVDESIKAAADVGSLLEALGVMDPGAAMQSIAELKDARVKLAEALAEVDSMLATVGQVEEAQAEADVTAALSAKSFDESARPALLGHRKAFITECVTALGAEKAKDAKAKAEATNAGRVKFLSHYGVPDERHAHLLSVLVADRSKETAAAALLSGAPGVGEDIPDDVPKGAKVIELTKADVALGPNNTVRAMVKLSKSDAEFGKLSYAAQLTKLSAMRRSREIVVVDKTAD